MLANLRNMFLSSPKQAPGPKLLNMRLETFESNFHAHLHYPLQLFHQYGEVIRLPDWHHTHLINAPELIGPILQNNDNYFTKENRFYNSLRKLLGKGLLTADDEQWATSRKNFQQAFQKQFLNHYATIISRNTKEITKSWPPTTLKKINITRLVFELTFTNALNALMNYSSKNNDTLSQQINRLNNDMAYGPTKWIPSWKHLRIKYNTYHLNKLITSIIKQPLTNPPAGVMPHFFNLYPDLKNPKQYKRAFADLKTLLVSGYETTGCLLNWAIYCLALCQDKQKKLHDELQQVLKDINNPTLTQLNQCHYLSAVIKEVLRLYPPIWHTWRKSTTELNFGRYTIPMNSHLLINFYILHRHPLYWEQPETFLPERFLTEKKPERFTYLPFGAGQHQCIASQFAIYEAKIVLAHLFKQNHLTLPKPISLTPNPKITLHANQDLKVHVK